MSRYTRERSVWFHGLPPTPCLYGMEDQPYELGNRSSTTMLENLGSPIWFPSFLLIGKVFPRVGEERLTMILVTPAWYIQILDLSIAEPLLSPQSQELLVESKEQGHPVVLNRILKLMVWKILVKNWLWKEFQTLLQNLSEVPGYQTLQVITILSGKKWIGWWSERQSDPITCNTNYVLDFLTNSFQYFTINSHRSAVSAYHIVL